MLPGSPQHRIRLRVASAHPRALALPLLLLALLFCCTAVSAAPAMGTGLSDDVRRLVEEEWRLHDEERLRDIREPGTVRFPETVLAWPGVGAGKATSLPRSAAPALDGRLDDPCWQGAASVPPSAPGEPAFRFCQDGRFLYAGLSFPMAREWRFRGSATSVDAGGAVDGVKDGRYAFHTNWEMSPWWQVDLGRPQAISRVVIYNRLDYPPGLHYADIVTILTSDDGKTWTLRHDNKGKHFGGVGGGGPLEVRFPEGKPAGVTARFVRLQLPSAGGLFFHLDEVEVYGFEEPARNLALRRPAEQSSLSIWSRGGPLGPALFRFAESTVTLAASTAPASADRILVNGLPAERARLRREGETTHVEVALPLRGETGAFPGKVELAGGAAVPLQMVGDWDLAWPDQAQSGKPLGNGRNTLVLDLKAPGLLSPPMEVSVEATVFTPFRPERGVAPTRRFDRPGRLEVPFEILHEGSVAVTVKARQGDIEWTQSRAFYIEPLAETVQRGQRLLADFLLPVPPGFSDVRARAAALAVRERMQSPDPAARAALTREARWQVRDIAFRNPRLRFDRLLFVKRFTQQTYPDVCLNHMPWVSRPGGDICILSPLRPDGKVRPLLEGRLGPGHVHGLDLWWDGSRVVFGYARARSEKPPEGWLDRRTNYRLRREEEPIHLFEMAIDGTGLKQLTRGEWSDLDPTYLPNGDIAFVSERCGFSLQCNEYDKDETSCNLYVMRPDGTGIRRLSANKDGDYLPHTLDNGLIGYTRWEYHERSFAHIQSLWVVRPDGTGADALFKQHFNDPWAVEEARSIPGSDKLVAIATGHHTLPAGPVVVLDPGLGINDSRGIGIVTPGVPSPEGGMSGRVVPQGGVVGRGGIYMHPWPLSEKHFLVSYAHGGQTDEKGYALYLIDVYGTRELIYRDPEISSFQPMPLVARKRPPILPSQLEATAEAPPSPPKSGGVSGAAPPSPPKSGGVSGAAPPGPLKSGGVSGSGASGSLPKVGEAKGGRIPDAVCMVTNVHEGVAGLPPGTIRYIRIAEPLGWPYDNTHGGQRYEADVKSVMLNWNPVRILGTVPVDADGSACFRVPADTAVYFQALDKDGMEVVRMRSFISFQPGETRGCTGCHETRLHPPAVGTQRGTAAGPKRRPSVPVPPPWGDRAVSFLRDVQPVFDRHCAGCHAGLKPSGGLDFSGGLTPRYNRAFDTVQAMGLVSRSNVGDDAKITRPLMFGSHKSKLIAVLRGSHRDRVKLDAESWERLVTWIDANAPYHDGFLNKRQGAAPYDLPADGELQEKIRAVHARRCASCHDAGAVTRLDWVDLGKPERSRFLSAPLAKAAGGAEGCGAPVYRDAADPDYQFLRQTVDAAVGKALANPRRDVAALLPASRQAAAAKPGG